MADKPGPKSPDAPAEPGVLASLSATRPARIGGERRRAGATKPKRATPAKPAKPAAAKAKPAKPRPKTTAAAKAGGARLAPKTPAERKPRPVRAGAAGLDAPHAGQRDATPAGGSPGGAELVTTAIQAAGELAQIGLTVGGQLLKRAVGKLPRP